MRWEHDKHHGNYYLRFDDDSSSTVVRGMVNCLNKIGEYGFTVNGYNQYGFSNVEAAQKACEQYLFDRAIETLNELGYDINIKREVELS